MANFYNSENTIINTGFEYPCLSEDIYILGLKEGEVLVSYNPQFMQNTNGLIIGIDSRFTHFYIVKNNKSMVKSLRLNWINDCSTILNIPIKTPNYYPIIGISIIGTLVLIIYFQLKRRKI